MISLRKEEVKSEAIKLLYANLPKSADMVESSPNQEEGAMEIDTKLLPDFIEMVRCISEKASSRMKSRSAVTYGTKTLPFDVVAFAEVRVLAESGFYV